MIKCYKCNSTETTTKEDWLNDAEETVTCTFCAKCFELLDVYV